MNILLRGVCSCQTLPLYFRPLNQANGLSEQTNPYFSQDSKGYMWIGSFDGLNRFDGKETKIYRPALSDGTYSPNLTSKVIEDKTGNLWFSTSRGLHCILRRTGDLRAISLAPIGKDRSANNEYVLVTIDGTSKLWVVADEWLHLYDPVTGTDSLLHPIQTYSCYPILDPNDQVIGLVNLLVDKGGGIEVFDYRYGEVRKSTWLTGDQGARFPKARILFATVEGDSLLWLPSDIGLIRFPIDNPGRTEIYNPPGLKRNTGFWDAVSYKGHYLIVSSVRHGLFLFDKRPGRQGFIFHRTFIRQGLENFSSINNVFTGRDGTLWLSVWRKGVFFSNMDHIKFQTWNQPALDRPGKKQAVSSIIEDKARNIWISSGDGEITMQPFSDRFMPEFVYKNGSSSNKLFCDGDGDVLAINSTSVYLKKQHYRRFDKVADHLNRLYNIVQFSGNDFLLICPGGAYKFRKGLPLSSYSNIEPALTQSKIFNAFSDSGRRIFISDGVDKSWIYRYSSDTFVLEKESLGVGYFNGMTENENTRWFASNKGLFQLDLNDFSAAFIKGKDRILENAFNAILQDNDHNLWLSSNTGLFRYNPATGEVKHYTESDGLQGMQFMPGSACKFSDGRLAFGGVNGLNVFHPDSVRDNPDPPVLHFTDWIVNDTGSISTGPEYLPAQAFGYDKRTLSFRFVGIDYTAPDEVRYRYRLKGFEKDTVEGGTNGFARYAQIPAGDYTFQVWAANSDGVWTGKPLELSFTILPPWYATWWARSLQGLLLAGLLYAFYRNRIARVRRMEAERRKEAEFRQKEAESKQLAAELQNSVLRLQMNPHFIFNSMNSISSYILQKDIDTANDYLGRFARLMRLILDLAAKRFIPVTDEIDLLEQYMAAEAMRFEKKFSWRIDVDNELDPEETMLPTMILQPFVENAIWHGFSGKTATGHIHIAFGKHADILICTVTDNGKGRKTGDFHKPQGHRSQAVEITEQRLRLIEPEGLQKTGLEIIDLYDNDGLPAGTKVVVRLPLDL